MSNGGGITEFLNELAESDALVALRSAHTQRSPFVFKLENQELHIKAFISSFSDRKIILSIEPNVALPLDKEVTLKFFLGTEVYFIKTTFKTHLNHFCIDMNAKVIQLKRRKEPRFVVPKAWNQSAFIFLSNLNGVLKCNVLDISNSGVRFEVLEQDEATFQRDDILKIKFQIHKRAEVATTAIVRFALSRPKGNFILGLEFANISELQASRVGGLVDDIQLFNNSQKN